MTAMNDKSMNDKDRFTMTELAALRNDLLQGGMIDSFEAAELLQVFLMGRGYGFRPRQRSTRLAASKWRAVPCPSLCMS